jgi:hypothetical protein
MDEDLAGVPSRLCPLPAVAGGAAAWEISCRKLTIT